MRLIKTIIAFLFILSTVTISAQLASGEKKSTNDIKIKSIFVYNFIKNTTWSKDDYDNEYIIAVLGDDEYTDEVYNTFKKNYSGKKVNDCTLEIVQFKQLSDVKTSHVLIVSDAYKNRMEEVNKQVVDFPTLTIGSDFPFHSAMINFILLEDKLAFSINSDELKRKNIVLSPTMYKLAKVIQTEKEWLSLIEKIENQIEKDFENISKDDLSQLVNEYKQKEKLLKEQRVELQSTKEEIEAAQNTVRLKIIELDSLSLQISNKNNVVINQFKKLDSLNIEIEKKNNIVESQSKKIGDKENELKIKNLLVSSQSKTLGDKENEIKTKDLVVSDQHKKLGDKENEILNKEDIIQNQKYMQYLTFGILSIIIIFSVFVFISYRNKKKSNILIQKKNENLAKQKAIIEEAHKEITDSINYAERIQRSFLASRELLDENLTDYFVFFQPKDVVSGDFYWAEKLHNGNFAIVNADSTGHGVPGAIMSILNISSIESALKDRLSNPADIFNYTRNNIIARLKKDGSKEGGKDGMDASLISFNESKSKMYYVAAQNPIWVVRKGELIEIKPEKMPVGKHENDTNPFQGGEFDLQIGDQIYTLTDGFQDQFGGPKGKKFMVKKMREYILSISHLPMAEQNKLIEKVFSEWKGGIEQVDDVCVIGIRV